MPVMGKGKVCLVYLVMNRHSICWVWKPLLEEVAA